MELCLQLRVWLMSRCVCRYKDDGRKKYDGKIKDDGKRVGNCLYFGSLTV